MGSGHFSPGRIHDHVEAGSPTRDLIEPVYQARPLLRRQEIQEIPDQNQIEGST
jgi:hypothetical protein